MSFSVGGVAPGGRLDGRRRHHLHQVVDDDVAERPDRVVEVAAILDAEALGHRDLHRRDVVAVPDRLEHRVREPQEEDLGEPHLPEEVVDPVELRLVEVLVDRLVELAGRGEVVPERLLDDDPRALGQAGLRQTLDHGAEQERRDLEVEDRRERVADLPRQARERLLVAEVAGHVREPGRETVEHLRVDGLARALDRRSRVLAQVADGPVVDGHADDRAAQQAAPLEPVQRAEGHHLGEVAGDAEHDEHVGRLPVVARRVARPRCECRGHGVRLLAYRRRDGRSFTRARSEVITQCG